MRPAGTVGGDDAHLVSTLPAIEAPVSAALPNQGLSSSPPNQPGVSSAPPPVAARPDVPAQHPGGLDVSADDTDVGWGERGQGTNDERLSADKPPHW